MKQVDGECTCRFLIPQITQTWTNVEKKMFKKTTMQAPAEEGICQKILFKIYKKDTNASKKF